MKNSGIEWIGEIPDSWNVCRIKNLPDYSVENCFIDGDWIESPDIADSGIRYLTTGNVGDGQFKYQGNGYITRETFDKLNCKFAYPGDWVIARLNAPYGRSCILPNDEDRYVLAVDIVILRTKYNKKYLCYFTQCSEFQHAVEDFARGTAMKRISRTNLGAVKIVLPSIAEQDSIADCLGVKCAEVDKLIEVQQAQIDKLKEYKQSVITEAVTKGLDPTVPMKDSGVEWIGMIPEGWRVVKNKVLFQNVSIKGFGNARVLSLYRDLGVVPKDTREDNHNVTSLDTDGYKHVKINDLVINKMKAWSGSLAISDYDGIVSPAYYVCKVNYKYVDKRFIHHYLRNKHMVALYEMYSAGLRVGQWDLAIDDFLNIEIAVPDSLREQKEIAIYIDDKCAKIDKLIAIKQAKIDKLQEYKKSLIYEYVTGKKEVM